MSESKSKRVRAEEEDEEAVRKGEEESEEISAGDDEQDDGLFLVLTTVWKRLTFIAFCVWRCLAVKRVFNQNLIAIVLNDKSF